MDLSDVFANAPAPVAADWAVRTGRAPVTPVELTPAQAVGYAATRGEGLTPADLEPLLGPGREGVLDALLGTGDPHIMDAALAVPSTPLDVVVAHLDGLADPGREHSKESRRRVAAEGTLDEILRTSSGEHLPMSRLGRLLLEGHKPYDLMAPGQFDRAGFFGYKADEATVEELEAVLRAVVEHDIEPREWAYQSEVVWEAAYRSLATFAAQEAPWSESIVSYVRSLSQTLDTYAEGSRPRTPRVPVPSPELMDMDPTEYKYWLRDSWSRLFPFNVEEIVQHRENLTHSFYAEGTLEVVKYLAQCPEGRPNPYLVPPHGKETLAAELAEWVQNLDPRDWNLPRLTLALQDYSGEPAIIEALKRHTWTLWKEGLDPGEHDHRYSTASGLYKDLPQLWLEFLRSGDSPYSAVQLADAELSQSPKAQKAIAERLLAGEFPAADAAAAAAHMLRQKRGLLQVGDWDKTVKPLLDLALSHPEGVQEFPWTRKIHYALQQRDPDTAARMGSMWVQRYARGEGPAPAPRVVVNHGTDAEVIACLGLLSGERKDQLIEGLLRHREGGGALLSATVEEALGSNVIAWGLLETLAADWSGSFTDLISTVQDLAD